MVLVYLTSSGSAPTMADPTEDVTVHACVSRASFYSRLCSTLDSRLVLGGTDFFPELHLVIQSAPPKPQFLMRGLNAQAFSLNGLYNRSSSVSDPDLS
jgi:hypothetical protein